MVDLNKCRSPIPLGGTEIKLKLFFDTRRSTWLKSLKIWSDDTSMTLRMLTVLMKSLAQATLEMTPRIDVFNF